MADKFSPDNLLDKKISGMSRDDTIRLGVALCDAIVAAVGPDGCHGGIRPGNVLTGGGDAVLLGPILLAEPSGMRPDEVEFVAPELFWRGKRAPTVDVYGVGLVLYCALSGGRQPFYPESGPVSSAAKAAALQRKMQGDAIPPLEGRGKKLSAAVMRCLCFDENDRFQTLAELKGALLECPLSPSAVAGAPAAAVIFDKPDSELTDVERMMSQIVKNSEAAAEAALVADVDPALVAAYEEEMSGDSAVPVVVAAELPAAAPAPVPCAVEPPPEPPIDAPADEPLAEQPIIPEDYDLTNVVHVPVEPEHKSAPEADRLEPVPVPPPHRERRSAPVYTIHTDGSAEEHREKKAGKGMLILLGIVALAVIILLLVRGCDKERPGEASPTPAQATSPVSAEPVAPTATPEPTPAQTPEPTPEQTPEPTPEPTPQPTPDAAALPAGSVQSENYTAVPADVSWFEAQAAAQALGGHLAVVHNDAELDEVIELAEQLGVNYVWLGAYRDSSGKWVWSTGESISYYAWDANEPSFYDGYDGTDENYLMLWQANFGEHKGWAYNDSRSDPEGDYPGVYRGEIAYIVQFD